eukprot:scaffold77602_cov21-Phaeocystis_antarctica.AAC.1
MLGAGRDWSPQGSVGSCPAHKPRVGSHKAVHPNTPAPPRRGARWPAVRERSHRRRRRSTRQGVGRHPVSALAAPLPPKRGGA